MRASAVAAVVAGDAARMKTLMDAVSNLSGSVGAGWLLLLAVTFAPLAQATQPQHFATPEAAVQALIEASRSGQDSNVLAVMGSDAKQLVQSGDAVADAKVHDRFLALYDESHTLVTTAEDHRVLQIGASGWPFPIPLVKGQDGWFFDVADGKEEVLARRVGQNELSAIQVCLAFADAEREYLVLNPEGAAPPHYADKLISSKGKRDGLYWPTSEGEAPSPLGLGMARADGYKFEQGKPTPFWGYYYRILTAQGPHAEGGAIDYKSKGQLYGGFALVAYPAEYGNSGVMSFIVNHNGVLFQKDLGKDTVTLARALKTFDPDTSWTQVPSSAESAAETEPPARAQ
jgi:hypothetical protein